MQDKTTFLKFLSHCKR